MASLVLLPGMAISTRELMRAPTPICSWRTCTLRMEPGMSVRISEPIKMMRIGMLILSAHFERVARLCNGMSPIWRRKTKIALGMGCNAKSFVMKALSASWRNIVISLCWAVAIQGRQRA